MPARQIIKIAGPEGGATGLQEVSFKLGYEYFKVFGVKKSGAGVITDITNIQPMINNKSIWEDINGADLDAIRKVRGLTPYPTNTILMLDFERQKFIDGVPRMATSINTSPAKSPKTGKIITNFGLKYTLGVALAMDWYAEVMPSDPAGPGYIPRLEKKAGTIGIETKQFVDLPYGAKDVLHAQWAAVYMALAAGNITQVELKNGSNSIIEPTPKAVMDQLLTDGGQVPGTDFGYILDFQRYNMPEFLDVLGIQEKTLALKVTSDTATDITFIVESLGEIE